jgi:hypothetical protein
LYKRTTIFNFPFYEKRENKGEDIRSWEGYPKLPRALLNPSSSLSLFISFSLSLPLLPPKDEGEIEGEREG